MSGRKGFFSELGDLLLVLLILAIAAPELMSKSKRPKREWNWSSIAAYTVIIVGIVATVGHFTTK